eukprot:Em0019g1100a
MSMSVRQGQEEAAWVSRQNQEELQSVHQGHKMIKFADRSEVGRQKKTKKMMREVNRMMVKKYKLCDNKEVARKDAAWHELLPTFAPMKPPVIPKITGALASVPYPLISVSEHVIGESKCCGCAVVGNVTPNGVETNESSANAASNGLCWFGFTLDLEKGSISVPEGKVRALQHRLKVAVKQSRFVARDIASLIGRIVSMGLALGPVATFMMRALQFEDYIRSTKNFSEAWIYGSDNHRRDPELRRLVQSLPATVLRSRADSTTKKYPGAFQRWKTWVNARQGVPSFSVQELHLVLYMQHLSEELHLVLYMQHLSEEPHLVLYMQHLSEEPHLVLYMQHLSEEPHLVLYMQHLSEEPHLVLYMQHLSEELHLVLYMQHLSESTESKAAVEEAVHAIMGTWGLQPLGGSLLVKSTLEGLRRILAKPKVRKEPVTDG